MPEPNPSGRQKNTRDLIEGYQLLKKLGEGGMGGVYLAKQLSMDRLVALKILRKSLSRDRDYVERFVREARLAGQLDHENIVRAIQVGESGGYHFLAMDYVEGTSLYDLMPEDGPMGEAQALDYVLQVTRGLDYAHKHGIIHRDIKPDNVLVDAKGVAKLTDLGLARQEGGGTRLTQSGAMMGTPHYMSPEQARGDKDVDIRSDIYSLGASLYHLVTGRPPFEGSSAAVIMAKHLTKHVPWPGDINALVSDGCCRLIQRMMAKAADDRYQTPEELIPDLEAVLDGEDPVGAENATLPSSIAESGAVQVAPRPIPGRRAGAREEKPEFELGEEINTANTGTLAPVGKRVIRVRKPVLIVAVAGLLLLGVLVGFAGASIFSVELPTPVVVPEPEPTRLPEPGNDPAEDASKEADEKLRVAFEQAEVFRKSNPSKYSEAIERFEAVRRTAGEMEWAARAAGAIADIRSSRQKAVDAEFASLLEKARMLSEAGDYDAALLELQKFPKVLEAQLEPRLAAERMKLNKQADTRIRATIAAAEKLSAEGQPQQGIAALEKVKNVKYAALALRVDALRRQLEMEKLNEAELARKRLKVDALKRFEKVLAGFDKLTAQGDYAQAGKFVREERKSIDADTLKLMPTGLDEAEKLAAELVRQEGERRKQMATLLGREVELKLAVGRKLRGKIDRIAGDTLHVTVRIGGGGIIGQIVKLSELAPGVLAKLLPESKREGAEAHLAAAVDAMARGDLAGARNALPGAKRHPLFDRWSAKLAQLDSTQRESVAESAWKKKVSPLVRSKYTVDQARLLAASLDSFAKTHGATKFAAGKEREIATLRTAAEKDPLASLTACIYGPRSGAARKRALLVRGGTQGAISAMEAALAWLHRHQEADGRWAAKKWQGTMKTDAGVTGLALLAFLGAGHTESDGKYQEAVRKATQWIQRQQGAKGAIGKGSEGTEPNGVGYHHAICGLALAEAYGMGKNRWVRVSAQKAVNYSVNIHQIKNSGWRYAPGQDGGADLSVTGWFVMQLRSAKLAGLKVPQSSLQGALIFTDSCSDRYGKSRYKAAWLSPNPTMTSVGMLVRLYTGAKPTAPKVTGGANYLLKSLPVWGQNGVGVNMYYWYYGTMTMFQVGGEPWKKWNTALRDMLCDKQRKDKVRDGSEKDVDGSWDPVGAWATRGGRVYATAMAALCLEVYYRYKPIYRK